MKSLLYLFMSIMTYSLHAKPLTLDEAKSDALKDSPDLQKSKSIHEETSWKRVEAYSGFLPSVTAQANYLTAKKYLFTNVKLGNSPTAIAIPGIVPTSNLVIQAQLPLFDGFASTNRLKAAYANERASLNEYEWAKFQTERMVSLQFFRAIAARTIKDVYADNLKTLEDHLREARLFRQAGTTTNFDILRVEVQVSEAKSDLINATDNVDIARSALSEILGREADDLDLQGELPIINTSVLQGKNWEGQILRKDLLALQEKVDASGFQESASEKYLVPKLALFSQYQFYNNLNDRFSSVEDYRNAYQVGLSLTWNLFDGMTSIARSKQSVEQRYQSERTLKKEKLKARNSIDIWKRKFLYNCSLYEARLSDVKKSNESVRLAKQGQKVGARTNTDVLDAVYELQRAQAGVVNSQLGAIESLIQLELASGEKIYEFH